MTVCDVGLAAHNRIHLVPNSYNAVIALSLSEKTNNNWELWGF